MDNMKSLPTDALPLEIWKDNNEEVTSERGTSCKGKAKGKTEKWQFWIGRTCENKSELIRPRKGKTWKRTSLKNNSILDYLMWYNITSSNNTYIYIYIYIYTLFFEYLHMCIYIYKYIYQFGFLFIRI